MAKDVAVAHGCLMAGNICNTHIYDPDDPQVIDPVQAIFKVRVYCSVLRRVQLGFLICGLFAVVFCFCFFFYSVSCVTLIHSFFTVCFFIPFLFHIPPFFSPPSLFSTYTLIDHIFTDSQDLVHTVSVTNNSTHQWPLPVLCTWSIKLSRHACTHRLHHHSNRTFQRFNKEAILFTEAVLFSVMFIILNAPDDAM